VMALTVLIIARRGRPLGLGDAAEMTAASESS